VPPARPVLLNQTVFATPGGPLGLQFSGVAQSKSVPLAAVQFKVCAEPGKAVARTRRANQRDANRHVFCGVFIRGF
jgi:hypothetical protein